MEKKEMKKWKMTASICIFTITLLILSVLSGRGLVADAGETGEQQEEPTEAEEPEGGNPPEVEEPEGGNTPEEEDTTPPEKVIFTYNIVADGDICFSNQTVELNLKSEDEQSGVEMIIYSISTGETGIFEGAEGILKFESGFHGTVEAYAVDKAGNHGELSVSKEIFCEDTAPEIGIFMDGIENGWNTGPVNVFVTAEDPEISSGIQSLKCYVNHELVVHQSPDGIGTDAAFLESAFTVDCCSVNGAGIPVVVEVMDRAGNCRTENRLLYIDMTSPQIEIRGSTEKMITGNSVNIQVLMKEENILAAQSVQIWRTGPETERELYLEKNSLAELEQVMEGDGVYGYSLGIHLEEDGYYEIYVTVQDMAGNANEMHQTLTIDRTNPVIRYVEQMQGVYIPYFQWNYDIREMIRDFTEYRYQMTLNGIFYVSGENVTEEGMKVLRVTAVDAAGNEAVSEAVFYIDHTPPEIQIYDVADQGRYKDEVTMNVTVGGKGESLEELAINSEQVPLAENSQIFRQTFLEPDVYEIRITAKDLAGNRAEKEITFTLEEQKGLAGVLLKPVTKMLDKKDIRSKEKEMAESTSDILWFPYVLLILFAVGAGINLVQRRRRKRQNLLPDRS